MLRFLVIVPVFGAMGFSAEVRAQEIPPGRAVYEPELKDPVLEKIKERNRKADEERDALTAKIRSAQKERKKKEKEEKRVLRTTLPDSEVPPGLEIFKQVWHFPPQAQYMTGTCWAFSATSFLESEVFRLTGRKIKLSEMHTVYYEYVEKARRFVAERGDSLFTEGSETNAVVRIWKMYGAVPLKVYPGIRAKDGLHDHMRMSKELTRFLEYIKSNDLWEEDYVLGGVTAIMERYMGRPPAEFKFEGRRYTPVEFTKKVLKFQPDDYVDFMSTTSVPFFTKAELKVPDNWWHDANYHNIPLDLFIETIRNAVNAGYSIAIGGDVSEPGKSYRQDVAFVPAYDIPEELIDQDAREYRIENGSTTDDHGVHLVGIGEHAGHTWYLVKDSGRSARHGRFEGYYFFREDFVKLKMLSFMVHKDAVRGLLVRFGGN